MTSYIVTLIDNIFDMNVLICTSKLLKKTLWDELTKL